MIGIHIGIPLDRFFASVVPPAPGDVVSIIINDTGDTVDVKMLGLGTGGTYAFGFGSNNNPNTGTPKFIINATSLGFDDVGAATTIARTIYGTRAERTAYDTRTVAGTYTTPSTPFIEGETITQTNTGATATIAIPGSSGPLLYGSRWTGSPNNSDTWVGGSSGAVFTPTATPVQWGASASAPGPREFYDGTYTTVRIRLSNMVYLKDNTGAGKSGTACTANFLSGFYTKSGTPNSAVTAGAATNASTLAYTKTIADWPWGHYELVNGVWRVRCLAFQGDAQQGRPVRCVKFTVTDGTTTETVIKTAMAVDTTVSADDAQSGAEYFADFDAADFIQGAVLTANFIAYPWVGDTDSLLDTSAGAAPPSPLVGPRKYLCDKNNTYGVTMALVDAATGNDTTGVAYDSSVYNYLTAAPFATMGKAAAAIAAYNNTNHSRNDVGGGIVEMNDGNYNNLGSSNSYGTTPNAVITFRPSPGATAYGVKISGQSGNNNVSGRVKIENIEITSTTNNTWSTANVYIWLHKCKGNSGSNTPFNGTGMVVHVTQGSFPVWNMGLRGFSTGSLAFSVVRGVDLTGFVKSVFCYTTAFCKRMTKSGTTSNIFINGIVGYTGLVPVSIIYNNAMYGLEANGGDCFAIGSVDPQTTGLVFVQNIMEQCNASGSPLGSIASADTVTGNTPIENYIIWHNDMLGQRVFNGYNDAGTIVKYRRNWSEKNNYFDRAANKNDVFSPGNANRVGCWSVSNMVRGSGNFWAMTMVSIPGNFFFEFPGLSSFQPATSSANDVAQFIDLQATTGTNGEIAGAGNGDYHLQSDSPLIGLPIDQVLSHDIEGNARTLGDAAGAYTYP